MKITSLWVLILSTTLVFAQVGKGRVKGLITGLDGEPVPQVTLSFTIDSLDSFQKTITSKKNGQFVLTGLLSGKVTITAEKEGYAKRVYSYEQQQTEMVEISFKMLKEGQSTDDMGPQPRVFGSVNDSQGNPIPEVELTFTSDDLPGYRKTIVSGADGQFETSGIESALIQIYAKKAEYRDQIYRFKMENREFLIKDFAMQSLEEAYAEGILERPKPKSSEELAIEMFNNAVEPYQAGNFAEAEKLARQALDLNPNLEAAVKVVVYCNRNLNNWPETLKFAERFLEINPGDKGMIQHAMEAAKQMQDTAKVKAYRGKLKDMGEISARSVFGEALDALEADDDVLGLAKLQEVLKMDPKYAQAYHEIGKIKIREGDFEAALLNLKLFLKHAPADHELRAEVTDLIVALSE